MIRCYERGGDELVVEVPLREVDAGVLRKVLRLRGDDPVYDCYPVGDEELFALQAYVDGYVDLCACECFLECDSGE